MSTQALPNLIIPGVAKAGTTSLFSYLGQHPAICPSDVKELNHFSSDADPTSPDALVTYAGHFRAGKQLPYRLEASPSYYWAGEDAVRAITTTLDRPRVIVALRDPVARFWSAYTYMQGLGKIPGSQTCAEFLSQCERRERDPAGSPVRVTPLGVGLYARHLPLWLDTFGERATVVFAEQLSADPGAVLAGLCRWLGVRAEPLDRIDYGARNTTRPPRSRSLALALRRVRPTVRRTLAAQPATREGLRRVYDRLNGAPRRATLDRDVRERLDEHYRDANRALAEQLRSRGYGDLPQWLSAA